MIPLCASQGKVRIQVLDDVFACYLPLELSPEERGAVCPAARVAQSGEFDS
jgi:hypothetical protein